METPGKVLVSIQDAATLLGHKKDTIRRYIIDGKVTAIRFSKTVQYVELLSLIAFMDARLDKFQLSVSEIERRVSGISVIVMTPATKAPDLSAPGAYQVYFNEAEGYALVWHRVEGRPI